MADTSVIFEGILEKKGGGLSKWKKAHYVLTKNKLTAYAKKGASKAKDTYALAGMSVTKVTDRDDNRFTLSLSSGEHLFRCNSDELRTEWITNFHVATSEVLSNPANQGAIASAAAAVATATAPTTPPPTATKPATPPEPELGDPSESSSEAAPRDTGDVEAMVVTTPVPTPEPETPPPVTAARPKKAPPKKPVRRDSRPPKPTPGDAPTTPATRPAAATPVTPPQPSPPAEDSLSDDKDDSVSTPAPAASSSGTRGTTGGSSAPRSRTTGATTAGVAAPRVSAGGVPPSRALPAGSDIESLEQAIARACDHKPRMVAAEKVSDDYLKAQSAVPVRLTKFLHAERQFLADVYALDANTTTLVEHYREQSQLLDLVIESIAALSDQVKFGDEGSDLVIREIALRIPMRDKLRNSCITTLMQVVEVLDNKREQYKQRTKALDESLTKLFNAFDATVTNPLFQADAVSSFTGISKTLFELHYTIFENIQEALQEARREDLRAQAMYHTLGHIEEEHYRYSSLLEEHKRVAALSNESNSIWNQLDSNRNEILDAQDDCEELQIKVRKLRRRGGGRGGSESKEELEASLRQKQEHMGRLDEQQERLRNRLKYLYAQGFREVFSIKPDKMDSMAEHLVRTGVEAVRYMDQYLEIDADRFADASNDTSLGLSMSFEGHDCLVLQVPTKADEETSRFVREVLLPLRAPHPNVVAIEAYFYEEDQSCAYIQSTLFHQSLVDWSPQVSLDDPSVKFESLRSIFVGAFHGLAHLHSHAVTHRNLTPSDILIDPTGTPIIHGFGISPDDRDMIALANAKLTAHYIAPEVVEANGDNAPVPSRDVWSLGVILFEKCYGRFPDNPDIEAFDRDSKDTKAFACCRRVLNMDPEARATAAEALLHPFFVEPAAANTPSMAARQAKITTFVEDLEAFRNSVSTGDRATVEFAPATLVDDVIAHFSAINTAEELAAPVTFAYAGDVADCDAGYWDVHPLTKFFEEVVSSRDDVFRSVIRGPYLPVAGDDAAEPAVFEAIGRAMVKCLVDGVVMPLDMAPSFFHFVSGLEIRDLTLEDALLELERYDADIASGLRNTVASKLDEESGVTMGSMCGCNDETVVIDGNKVASVIESAQFVLIESRRDRLEALKAAFGLLSAQVPSLLELEAVDLAAMVAGPRAAAKDAFAWGIGGDTEGADALATWWRSAGQYAIKCASFDLAGVVGPKTVAKHKVVNLPVSVHTRDSLGLLLSPNFHILDLPPGGGAGGVAEAMSASQARHIYEPVAATPTPVAPKPARSPKPTSSLPTP